MTHRFDDHEPTEDEFAKAVGISLLDTEEIPEADEEPADDSTDDDNLAEADHWSHLHRAA